MSRLLDPFLATNTTVDHTHNKPLVPPPKPIEGWSDDAQHCAPRNPPNKPTPKTTTKRPRSREATHGSIRETSLAGGALRGSARRTRPPAAHGVDPRRATEIALLGVRDADERP